MKAAIYARYSTDRQNESSIADQVRVCAEYARVNGMTIVERFDDQGISGAAEGNRPGVRAMREAAMAGHFEVLLVTDLSRLSRSTGDLNKMIDRLVARGVRVVGVQDGYDSARRGHKLQAGLAGIIGEAFRDMIRDRTHAALESRAKAKQATGGRAYGYRDGAVCEAEAAIVREIFERFCAGASCRAIAAELNRRGVPSPGSSWQRTKRRSAGWMGSAIRSMLRNERYTGAIHWNTSVWIKDPDTGKRHRRPRPRGEWITHVDETLRIVSGQLFQRAQDRMTPTGKPQVRSGGKARYLFSGLLHCAECGSKFVIADARSYACSSHVNGNACGNTERVTRKRVEEVFRDYLRDEVLDPERLKRVAREFEAAFQAELRASHTKATERPKELEELAARITRLKARAAAGDPDLTADELQAAIERAEAKRCELENARPEAKQSARLLALVPKAAEVIRRQFEMGLDGNPREAEKARVALRGLLGKIRLERDSQGLIAHWDLNNNALLRVAVGAGSAGSGGRI